MHQTLPPHSDARPPAQAWLMVALLWLAACSYNVAQLMVMTMHGSVMITIPMTETQFGLMTSMFPWVFGTVSLFAGYLSDRLSRKWVVIVAVFAWSVITWLTSYATTFPQLLAMRALLAVSQACYLPAAGALIADYHRGSTRSLAAAVHLTGFYVGAVLGGVGGWLAERHTWGYAFVAVGVPGLVYSLILIFTLREGAREDQVRADASAVPTAIRLRTAFASLFTSRSFIVVLVCVTLADALGWLISAWMPTHMAEHFHLGQGAAGFSSAGSLNGTTIFGLVLGGAWSDRWSKNNQRSRFLVPAIGIALAVPSMLVVVNTSTLSFAIAGLLLTGLTASWFTANLLPMLCLTTDVRFRATGYGLINAVVFIVGGIVIYLGGVLRDAQVNLRDTFNVGIAGSVICVGLLLLLKPATTAPTESTSAPSK